MKNESLILESVRVSQNESTLICVDATIAPGSVLTIMGPSGVGKSLLLSAIAGVLPAPFSTSGKIRCGREDITALPAHRRQLGVLYQDPLLFEHLNVAQNIAFGMPDGIDVQRKTNALLESVGLANYGTRAVQQLSGGQQARVALLRTLASAPRAVLLDEPFSKLDAHTRQQTRAWVFAKIKDQQLPCIMVTHDGQDARAAGGDVIEVGQSNLCANKGKLC